jgi:hypothetical protein
MVRRRVSAISNHEARTMASSFETPRFSTPLATASLALGLETVNELSDARARCGRTD